MATAVLEEARLTQLATIKTRLRIDRFGLQYDAILTSAIEGVSERFDKECNRERLRRRNGPLSPSFVKSTTEGRLALCSRVGGKGEREMFLSVRFSFGDAVSFVWEAGSVGF